MGCKRTQRKEEEDAKEGRKGLKPIEVQILKNLWDMSCFEKFKKHFTKKNIAAGRMVDYRRAICGSGMDTIVGCEGGDL